MTCDNCKHHDKHWDQEPCEHCSGANPAYEQRDPATDGLIRKNDVLYLIDDEIDFYSRFDSDTDPYSFANIILLKKLQNAVKQLHTVKGETPIADGTGIK